MKNMLKTLAKENEGSLPAVKTENIKADGGEFDSQVTVGGNTTITDGKINLGGDNGTNINADGMTVGAGTDIKDGNITVKGNEGKVEIGKDGAITTVQTLSKIDQSLYAKDFEVVISDECVPFNTLINTPLGKIQIATFGDSKLSGGSIPALGNFSLSYLSVGNLDFNAQKITIEYNGNQGFNKPEDYEYQDEWSEKDLPFGGK